MKRLFHVVLVCALALTISGVAAAQSTPTPVVRMGDWLEIGDDVFLNIFGTASIRYITAQNSDLENDIRDTVDGAFNAVSGRFTDRGHSDAFFAEVRLGADFRYQKNLSARILLEADSVYDGNLIDDRSNSTDGTANDVHVERFWIDYTFTNVPLRMRVGADLWCFDLGCLVSDDDPGFKLFYNAGDIELRAWTIKQSEGVRLGLTNDNDDTYFLFGARYTGMKGHTFAVDFLYDRDRFNESAAGRESDFYLIMPAWQGKIGPLSLFAEGAFGFGEVRMPTEDFDIANWAILVSAQLKLGKVTPYLGFIYGSGDDDANDRDLNGFNPVNHADVQLISLGPFPNGDSVFYDLESPCAAKSPICGGQGGLHTITNPFHNNVGNTQHGGGLDSEFSNAGTLIIIVGTRLSLIKQHSLDVWYVYAGVTESELMETQARAITGDPNYDISTSMYHNIGGAWKWTLNKHFNITFTGNLSFAADGMKDIARTVDCGGQPCQGEDVQLVGEVQFQGTF